MAFRKRPAEGENTRFVSITPNGLGWDPTEGPPSGSGMQPPKYRDTERWGQIDADSWDNSGSPKHDPLRPRQDDPNKRK